MPCRRCQPLPRAGHPPARPTRRPQAASLGPAAIVLAVLCGVLPGCTSPPPSLAADRLGPCPSDRALQDARCGTLTVYEDRAARSGRRIDLSIVVLPAAGEPRADPLFFLAGGPGQGAASMADVVAVAFETVRRNRDLVLVDQRGTGRSHPLNCRLTSDSLRDVFAPEDVVAQRIQDCLRDLDADVRLYTTSIAMDDLDEVRAYLGYEQVNLYGGSYGTRAALVYLRRHGSRVRSVVLDGVAPTSMRLPLFAARDAEMALRKVMARCETSDDCRRAYPDLAARVNRLLRRLEAAPARVRLVHPRTGDAEDVTVDAKAVASMIFGALYAPQTAAMLPLLVDRAGRGDFQGLLALALAREPGENMSVGMQLAVLCSEDAPQVAAGDVERETAGLIFAGHLAARELNTCRAWPRGAVEADYYDPVVADVPALILSGEVDPVTPASWGDSVATHLRRSRHVVAPGTGHGVAGTACGARITSDFLERGSADGLDTGCLQSLKPPPFFMTFAGPDQTAAR